MSLHKLKSLKGGFVKISKNKSYGDYDEDNYKTTAKKKKKINRTKEISVESDYQDSDTNSFEEDLDE